MSFPVNLQALPCGVLESVFTPDNVRGRTSVNSLTQLSFPKSRVALWDSSPAGEKLHLHFCSHRKPRIVLLEKALRLAQRHARQSSKPCLHCFFLGSASVDSDEEGLTVALDRFDPGRDQSGNSSRVPSAFLPGDVVVPCLFSTQSDAAADVVVQSEADLHFCFKAIHQCLNGRQTVDLSQLLKVRGYMVCSQQSDAASFNITWLAVCPSASVSLQPVKAVPIIPTALLRSLTNISRPLQPTGSRQRGFLTMDQSRKLLFLLESDPKASSLPLVGVWLTGVTHVYNPHVWAWCLRFLFSSSLQDRVLSESGCFLLVVFGSTHRGPQFFQCKGPRLGPGLLEYQLLKAFQTTTLYQVALIDGQNLQCELSSEDNGRQIEVFRDAQSSFNNDLPHAYGPSISDRDSGVEDEDLSPRPSPSPHPPAQQVRRVQPSVPELSLLIDSSFASNHSLGQVTDSSHRQPSDDRNSSAKTSSSASKPAAPALHLHSTPNSNLQQPCTCCTTQTHNCTSVVASPALLPPGVPPASAAPPPVALCNTPPSVPHRVCALPSNLCSGPCPSHHSPPPPSSQPSAPPSHHHTPSPPPLHPVSTPPDCNPPSPFLPPTYTCQTVPSPFTHPRPPPPSLNHSKSTTLHTQHHTPPTPSTVVLPPAPPRLYSHQSPLPWCSDSPFPHTPHPAASSDPTSTPWLTHPSSVNKCWDLACGGVPSDAYQLLLHQDQQLRLLQAQVQMLLEAQKKLQSSNQQVETQTSRSTASIAVGTGTSLFWGNPIQPLSHQAVQAPSHSLSPGTPSSPKPPPSSSTSPSASTHDVAVMGPVDGDASARVAAGPPFVLHSLSGLQSPVLGESVSMYTPADEQQSFYRHLMNQLTSRLQESDSKQEMQEESRRESVVSEHSPSFQTSSSSTRRKEQSPVGDTVISATLQQLQQLGVNMDEEDVTEYGQDQRRAVESVSTLASINPAAVLSRLSVPEPTASTLFPGSSVDLSLEANAIALRYLSDSQLSRLSLGSQAPLPGTIPSSSCESVLSPSNMSLATRKYMRRYGLIEEEDCEDEEEEEEEEVRVQGTSARRPLTESQNFRPLPQSQLIRDLRPKLQLLAGSTRPNCSKKENFSSRRPSLVRASSRQSEASVGNILDLSRLRQLPKLF
ncbi:SCL-interrupting locus protein homolog [Pholidichthys leucotaenia]